MLVRVIFILSLLIFFFMNILWILYDPTQVIFYTVVPLKFSSYYIYIGIDGISLFFMYLTSFLTPLCILYCMGSSKYTRLENIICVFSIEVLLLLVFSVMDLLFFYVFFEAVLVPFFIMIGIRGSRTRKIHAAYSLFFYTLVGSLLMLCSIFTLYMAVGSTDFQLLYTAELSMVRERLVWWGFFIAFAVKVPMLPFHLWLPEAHVESPTEGSVILAGVLLKVGLYGMLRILLQIFYEVTMYYYVIVVLLGILSIFYTSLTTLRQIDIKRVIAYSSIAHMNLCVLGLMSFNILSICGSILLMFGHGLVSCGLFFVIGMLYDRFGTKIVKYYSGLAYTMPLLSIFFFFFVLGNISMPGTSNFIGEFLIICGLLEEYNLYSLFVGLIGILCCTIYTLWVYNKVIFGLVNKKYMLYMRDITYREFHVLLPLAFFTLLVGVCPTPFVDLFYYSISYGFNIYI